jgi:hypothetical protein
MYGFKVPVRTNHSGLEQIAALDVALGWGTRFSDF